MVDVQLLEYLESFISEERKNRFLQILDDRTKYITVAIEDLYQFHNTTAVIRCCGVFIVQEAHVKEGRFGKRLDKNITMGAQQWVDVHRYKTIDDCVATHRTQRYRFIATKPHEDSSVLSGFEIKGKAAFLFGTEF